MIAREQARSNAQQTLIGEGTVSDTPQRCADAASDVWEPLLRDLLVAYEHAVAHKGRGHRLDGSLLAWGGYTRAKEALGASDS